MKRLTFPWPKKKVHQLFLLQFLLLQKEALILLADRRLFTTSCPYIVMELLKGKSLDDVITANGPYLEREAWGIYRQLLSAMRYLWERGIIHRDIVKE